MFWIQQKTFIIVGTYSWYKSSIQFAPYQNSYLTWTEYTKDEPDMTFLYNLFDNTVNTSVPWNLLGCIFRSKILKYLSQRVNILGDGVSIIVTFKNLGGIKGELHTLNT